LTPSDLDRIERELGIRLPADYRALLTNYPAALGRQGSDYELLDDPQPLIEINTLYRAQGFFDMPWPEHYYSIGGDGSGNDYYLDLRVQQSPVYFADHEGSIGSEQWPSLDAWLAERIKEHTEWEEEDRRRQERKSRKKWWQFWI